MILELLRTFMGPAGRAIADFIAANPWLFNTIFLVWLGVWGLGYLQLRRIKHRTLEFTLTKGQEIVAQTPCISADSLYRLIYPQWETAVVRWGWFIPHRLGIWPERIVPERLGEQLHFSPEWITVLLRDQRIELKG
jgi:hypothetical protein